MRRDEMVADWVRRAGVARRLTEQGELWPAWSTGEILAVAVILGDEEMLRLMDYTRAEAIERLRYELGGGPYTPLTVEQAEAEFGRMRAALDGAVPVEGCACPTDGGVVRHRRGTCTDPVVARLDWYANGQG